tara:strand:- start:442 stop:648 length:207 start_codon:yes stop_codon:yes gene_type:complete
MAKKSDIQLENIKWELENEHCVKYTESQARTILRKCRKEVAEASRIALTNTIYDEVERMDLPGWQQED